MVTLNYFTFWCWRPLFPIGWLTHFWASVLSSSHHTRWYSSSLWFFSRSSITSAEAFDFHLLWPSHIARPSSQSAGIKMYLLRRIVSKYSPISLALTYSIQDKTYHWSWNKNMERDDIVSFSTWQIMLTKNTRTVENLYLLWLKSGGCSAVWIPKSEMIQRLIH